MLIIKYMINVKGLVIDDGHKMARSRKNEIKRTQVRGEGGGGVVTE